jgi:O-antigen ligase
MNIVLWPIYLIITAASILLMATPYFFLAALPGAAVLGFMGLLRWPRFGYYLIVFLIPFGAYRGYKFVQLPWLLAFGLMMVLYLRYLPEKKWPHSAAFDLWPWLIVFFAINAISTLISPYPETAIKNLALQAIAYLFVLLSLVFVSEKGFRRTLPAVLTTSISLCACLAVAGYFFNIALFAEKVTSGSFKRGLGGTTDPNNLALMILVVMPFLVYYLFYSRGFMVRTIAMLLIIVNLLGLATTFSRSGAVVLLLVGTGLFLEHMKIFRPKALGLLISGGGICLVALCMMLPEGYLERQLSLVKLKDKSIGRRTSYIFVAWDAFKENPVLGTGPGTFRDIYSASDVAKKFMKEGKTQRRFAHNSYLEIVVGSGLPGLFVFLFAITKAFLNYIKAQKAFSRAGEMEMVALVKTYRISFTAICLYLFVFSEPFHKHLLLLLVMSQVACRLIPKATEPRP